jgi:DNA polymerase III subunit alpha
MSNLVHLHSHSSFSVFDGTGSPDSLAQRAAELELPAQAITDHGRVSGVVEFHKACGKHGVTPIHGMEAYVQADDIQKAAHLILLAGNQEGLHNLYRLSTLAEQNYAYRRGCITRSMLEEHHGGLVMGSACIGSEVGQMILRGDMAGATERARWYRDLLGERYYLELQNQNDGQPNQDHLRFMHGIIEIGETLEIPVVATNDSHYVCSVDKEVHRLVILMGNKGDLLDAYAADLSILDRRAFLRKLRLGHEVDVKPYVDNTMGVWRLLQDMGIENVNPCRKSIAMPQYRYVGPRANAKSMPPIERIRRICQANLKVYRSHGTFDRRQPSPPRWEPMTDEQYAEYRDRIEHELHIIGKTGFGDYFLIVADYVRYVKEDLKTLVGSGRGSAAGSLVAYLLRITEVDPIKYGLMFERMLNIDRPPNKPPDIDLDFTPEVRTMVIDYLEDRYGQDHVIRIGSFGNMKLRDAIRRVGSHHKMTRTAVSLITNKVPDEIETVDDLMQKTEDGAYVFSQLEESFERDTQLWSDVTGLARQCIKHEARHAAGVIVSSEPIGRWCPMRIPRGAEAEHVPISQFDMYALEDVGLIKFDLLVLGTMRVLTDCVEAAREQGRQAAELAGETIRTPFSLSHIDLEDPSVYRLFAEANTRGVFQLSSNPSIRELFAKLEPRSIEDLAVGCALYRPGPLDSRAYWDGEEDPEKRKDRGMSMTTRSAVEEYLRRRGGRSKVRPVHPLVDEILAESYGILIYQEQILKLATACAGYTTVEADRLREAVGKKKQEMLRAEKPKFIQGATAILGSSSTADSLWDCIKMFGNYGFNKAHSVSYAMLSYQTAWLKRHHPAIFYAALINQELRVRNQDRMVEYVYDAPRNGVEVLQPDIRTAGPMCQVVEGGAQIRMGLEGVKGISANGSTYLCRLMADPDNHELDAFLLAAAPKALKNSLVVDMVEIGLMDSMIDVDESMEISEKLHLRGRVIAALEHVNMWRKKCADHPLYPSGQGFYNDVEALIKEKVTYYELRDLEKETNRRGLEKWQEALHAFQTFHLNLDHVLSRENEVLGMFVSGDPLASYADLISGAGLVEFSSLEPRDHGDICEFAGVISSITQRTAKASKRQYSEIRVGDGTHSIETLVFYNEHIRESSIAIGNVIRFEAKVQWKEGHTFVLRIRSVAVLGNLGAVARQSYRVGINCRRLPMQKILEAREEVLLSPQGDSPVYLECGATVGLLRSVAMTGELQTYLDSLKHVTIVEQMQDFPEEMAS